MIEINEGLLETRTAAPAARAHTPSSDKQRDFAKSLGRQAADLAEGNSERLPVVEGLRSEWAAAMADRYKASAWIDAALALVRAWRVEDYERRPEQRILEDQVPDGMHKTNGVIYKVQAAVHGSGRPYAKVLVEQPGGGWAFEYAPGAIRNLSRSTLLSLEEAKEFGVLYGTCCACGRTLTDESSIAAGIGPVCATRF